jgi:hypothetical protein
MREDNEFTQHAFIRGLVGALVQLGRSTIRPQHTEDREGFIRIIRILNDVIREVREKGTEEREWYKQLVRLRNGIQQSNNGSFDNFETSLRDLQISITNCPNPFYEFIVLQISPPFAQTILNELPASQREVVMKAARAFLNEDEKAA